MLNLVNNTFKSFPINKSDIRYGVIRGDGENTTVGRGISRKKLWHFRLGALAD